MSSQYYYDPYSSNWASAQGSQSSPTWSHDSSEDQYLSVPTQNGYTDGHYLIEPTYPPSPRDNTGFDNRADDYGNQYDAEQHHKKRSSRFAIPLLFCLLLFASRCANAPSPEPEVHDIDFKLLVIGTPHPATVSAVVTRSSAWLITATTAAAAPGI